MRIWSKLCGPVTCPKMFINSFMNDPFLRPYGLASVCAGFELDIETERAEFLHQHIEGFRNAGLEIVVAANDRLIDFGTAGDVVGFHREHLLERVGGAI